MQHFYWKGIKKQLAEFIKACSECKKCKITAQKKYEKFEVKFILILLDLGLHILNLKRKGNFNTKYQGYDND